MQNKVELKYVASESEVYGPYYGYWELTIYNNLLGKQVIKLNQEIALGVAVAISTAREAGIQEGYNKAKKKYKPVVNKPTVQEPIRLPWEDSEMPMLWKPELKLNDPRK